MTLLPIVARELRLAVRSKATYWGRVTNAIVAAFLGGYFLTIVTALSYGRGAKPSPLTTLGFPIFYLALFMGVRAADAISEEKREGTLGLLFLTDLKGYDVVLGKLCFYATTSFYGLLAMMPVVSLSMMMGGVTGGEVFRACLVLFNTLFFSHTAAILVSTFSIEKKRAVSGTTTLILFFMMILPIILQMLKYFHFNSSAEFLANLSPFTAAQFITLPPRNPGLFWWPLLGTHLCSWAFLLIACWQAPRCWQDKAGTTRLRWRERSRQWTYGNAEARTQLRRALISVNPFHWLLSRARFKPAAIWGFLAAVAVGCVGLCIKLSTMKWTGGNNLHLFIPVAVSLLICHLVFKMWAARESASYLEEQRKNGGLELLFSCTPFRAPEVLAGCWATLRRLFLWPTIVVLFCDLLLFIFAIVQDHLDGRQQILMIIPASMVMLVADMIAIGWVGLWRGLISQRTGGATSGTLRQILFLPWIGMWLTLMVAHGGGGEAMFWFAFALWLLYGLGTDIVSSSLAKKNLREKFHLYVTPNMEEKIGFFGKLGRALGSLFAPR